MGLANKILKILPKDNVNKNKKVLVKKRYTILFEDDTFTEKLNSLKKSMITEVELNTKISSTCNPIESVATSKNYIAVSPINAIKNFNKEYPNAKFISCYTN